MFCVMPVAYVVSHALACEPSRLVPLVVPTASKTSSHKHREPLLSSWGQNSPTHHIPSFVLLLLEVPSLPGGYDAGLMSWHDVSPDVIVRPGGKA